MNKIEVQKLINLGFLESKEICSIYGQEIVDNFLDLLFINLKKEGFKHYNIDLNKSSIKGKYYRLINHYLEILVSESNIQNDALDLQHLFSKFLKDTLGVSLIEGSKVKNNFNYYYGYIFQSNFKKMYEIKQNNYKVFIKFDVFNIFNSIYDENSYLSYKIAPCIAIIPLHQNKSGVLSYANKIKNKIDFNSYVDERNISPILKKKHANNKRIPMIIYIGPKEYKNKKVCLEFNGIKEEINFEEMELINDYLERTLKNKYNQNLKKIYLFEKEVLSLEKKEKIIKVNICSNCSVEGYKYFLTPFNRINKNNKCIICNDVSNNIILLKKK